MNNGIKFEVRQVSGRTDGVPARSVIQDGDPVMDDSLFESMLSDFRQDNQGGVFTLRLTMFKGDGWFHELFLLVKPEGVFQPRRGLESDRGVTVFNERLLDMPWLRRQWGKALVSVNGQAMTAELIPA